MQRLILGALVGAVLSSCATSGFVADHSPLMQRTEVYTIDFSKYAKDGFYFSPYMYQGKYRPVGLYSLTLTPGATFKDSCAEGKPECKYWETVGWTIDKLSIRSTLDTMYSIAKAAGANGLVDIKISRTTESPRTGLTVPVFELSGFAIYRED